MPETPLRWPFWRPRWPLLRPRSAQDTICWAATRLSPSCLARMFFSSLLPFQGGSAPPPKGPSVFCSSCLGCQPLQHVCWHLAFLFLLPHLLHCFIIASLLLHCFINASLLFSFGSLSSSLLLHCFIIASLLLPCISMTGGQAAVSPKGEGNPPPALVSVDSRNVEMPVHRPHCIFFACILPLLHLYRSHLASFASTLRLESLLFVRFSHTSYAGDTHTHTHMRTQNPVFCILCVDQEHLTPS